MKKEHEYEPYPFAGFRLIASWVMGGIFILITVAHTGEFSWPAVFIGAVGFLMGLIVTSSPCEPLLFSFRKYVRRNIRGYYKVWRWERINDEEIKRFDPYCLERRQLRARIALKNIIDSETGHAPELIIAIPLGGWFTKLKMRCNWPPDRKNWKIKRGFKGYYPGPDSPHLWLLNEDGVGVGVMRVEQIAELAADSSVTLPKVVDRLLDLRDHLQKSENESIRALTILFQTIEKIKETSRFKDLKEGKDIREWIEGELNLLPVDYERRLKIQAAIEKDS